LGEQIGKTLNSEETEQCILKVLVTNLCLNCLVS